MPPTTFDFNKEIGALKTPVPQQGGFDFAKELGVPPTGGLVASAKQTVGKTIKGAGQVGADFIPGVSQGNVISQYGQSVIDANPTAIGSLKDIAARPLTAATEAVGNALPSLGSIVGLRALGTAATAAAPFTGIAAPATAAVGQAISWGGPLIAAALPSYSGIRDAQMENGVPTTTKDKAVAGAGALASGAIELVGGPQTRIVKAISGGLKREAGEGLLKAVGKEAFKSGLEEAGEELVQNPIEQLASYQNPTSAANIEQTLFGGAMGFIGGGIAGGGMQAVAGRQQEAAPAAEDRDTRTTEAVQAKALEGMVGTPVAVSNGQAYVQTGEGGFVVAPLDKLTQHFATGGTLENVNTEALTVDSLNSLQTQLDDPNNPVDLGYLTKLRNSRTELIQAGVNKQDVDTMILNNTENTPGRREYVAQLLTSGQPDPTAIQEIGSGKIDSPNAPLQAEWQRQEELAAATNRSNLRRLQETAQRVQGEKDLLSYWQSIGAVDTPEEGRAQLDAWRAAQEERIAQDNADLDQAVASAMVGGSQEALQAKQTAMRNRYALQRLQNQDADVQKKRAIAEAMAEYEQTLRVPGSDAITARQQDNLDILEYWISAGEITSKEELKRAELNLPAYWRSGGLTVDQLNRQQTATPVGPPPTEVLPPSPSAAPLTGVAPQQTQPQEVQNGQVQEGRNAPQVEPPQTREDLLRDERIRATSGAAAPALANPPQTREDLLRDERIRATSGAAAPALANPPQTREDLLRDERVRVGSTSKTPVSFISTGESAEEFLRTRPAPPSPAPAKKDVAKKVAPQPTTIEEMLDTTSSAKRAAMWLAKNAKDPANAAIARRLSSAIGGDIKLVLVQPGVKVQMGVPTELRVSNGVYWTTRRTVYIRGNGFTDSNGANEATVLHELLHAATARRLDFGRRGANKDTDLGRATRALFALQAQVADAINAQVLSGEFDNNYSEEERRVTTLAAANVDEMVSYGLSNPVFQGVLRKIQIKGESAFTRFTKAIIRLLGLKPSDSSALARLIDVTEGVLSNPEPIVVNGLFVAQDSVLQEGRNTPQVEPLPPSQAAARPTSPATIKRVQSEVKSFLGDVGHANLVRRGNLEVVQTQEDIPAGGEPFKGPSGTMAGAYDPATKRVYLVAGNLAPGDGEYVLRHEAVHALLREDQRFVRQKSGILASFETLAAKDASIREAIVSVPETTRGELRSEEALAYWIQNPANHTHSLFKRIVAAVKAALRRLGVNTKYSPAEIAQMFTRGTKQWATGQQLKGLLDVDEGESGAMFSYFNYLPGVDYASLAESTNTRSQNAVILRKAAKALGLTPHKIKTTSGFTTLYELDDSQAVIKEDKITKAPMPLENVLVHDDLFKLAPELRKLTVQATTHEGIIAFAKENRLSLPGPSTGGWRLLGSHHGNTILLNVEEINRMSTTKKHISIPSVLLHEIQHALGNGEEAASLSTQLRMGLSAADRKTPPNIILYSQATTSVKQGQKSLLGKVADIAAGQKVEQAPRWLAVSPLHFLVQTVGRKIPQVQQLSRHLEEANHISETMVSEAMQYYTEALDTKQQDKINRVAGVSSFNRMLPWAPITEQDWVPQDAAPRAAKLQGAEMRWKAAGMDKSTGKSFIAAYNEASKAYASLDEKAQTVYQTIVQHMQQIREREKNNLRAYIERTTVGDETLKEQLLQRYRATFNDVSGAYWPLNRVGDFRLEYVDIDGVRTVTHHSTDAERRGVIESLVADGVDRDTIMESYKDKRPRSEVAIPSELMQQLSAAVYKQKMSEVSPEDYAAVADAKDAAQAVVDDMNQIWLRWQPETSALKNAVQRKNVKGFSEDMLRSYLDYTQRHAGSIAWSEQGRKVEDTLKSLADDIRESRKTPGNKDATFKGMVLNDLRNRVQALRTAKIGPVASTLGRLGTAFYMTSPSTAVVQMTQLPILTLPKMATMYKSWGKASAAMARGVQQAFSSKFAKDKLFGNMNVDALHDMMRSTVTEEMEGKGQAAGKGLGEPLFSREEIEARYKQLTPYQQQLFVLREALARNLLDISAAHEAFALTQGKNPNSKLNKAFKYAMLPMQLSETASRKAAILSSMALSQDEASKDTPGSKKGFYEIMRDVSEVVNDTLYSYAKSNKPAVLQGGTARVLAMFQWYRIMTALRIGMLFKRSIAAETPEMKSAARKEFIGIMGMTGALAGAIGMPMTQLVFAALDVLADDDEPRDSELEFRNWAAERLGPQWGDMLVHGLPSTLGVDLSRRIGLDNIYGSQSQAPERLHGKELAAWWAANQLGPIFGIVQGAFQGYDLMVNKGEYAKGLEAAVPKPIRDVLKATRVMGDGELTSTSGKKIIGEDKLTGDAAILLALGLNPAEVSQAQSAAMSKSTLSTKLTERRGRLIRDAVDAITGEGDRDEALAAVRAFNKKMPAFAISGGDIRTALVRSIKESAGVQSKRDALIARQFSVPTY